MRDTLLIGAGHWGKNLARNMDELGRLAAMVDTNADTLESLRKAYPDVACSDSCDDFLKDGSIQAVVIATQASSHAAIAVRALEAGKHVFVEKPICLTLDEAQRIGDAERASGKILMVGHLLLYHPAVQKLKELIAQGELGKIQYIYSNRLNFGKIRTEENTFWSFAPHDVSVINHLLSESPTAVRADGGDYLTRHVHDTTLSLLQYPSGVKAHIFVSWLHPYKEQRLVVVGSQQMAVFSDTSEDKLVVYPHKVEWVNRAPLAIKAEASVIAFGDAEPLRCECEHFFDCIDRNVKPLSDSANARSVLQVLVACDQSLANGGERIELDTMNEVLRP